MKDNQGCGGRQSIETPGDQKSDASLSLGSWCSQITGKLPACESWSLFLGSLANAFLVTWGTKHRCYPAGGAQEAVE